MNNLLGRVITGLVVDQNDQAYFVQKSGITFQLAKEEQDLKLGNSVSGFAFIDQQGIRVLTTKLPQVQVNQFGLGCVNKVRHDLGVFVDIGLDNKDVVISLDDLPSIKELWPKKGDQLYLTLVVDKKSRIWGKLASEEFFLSLVKPAESSFTNKNITGIVFNPKKVGSFILVENEYLGFLHPHERYNEPRLGEKINGRVIGFSKNGVLNLSLKPRAHEVIAYDSELLLTLLKNSASGKIPYTDSTAPDIIKRDLGISKGQFKRAVGHLMKKKLAKQEDGFTVLRGE